MKMNEIVKIFVKKEFFTWLFFSLFSITIQIAFFGCMTTYVNYEVMTTNLFTAIEYKQWICEKTNIVKFYYKVEKVKIG